MGTSEEGAAKPPDAGIVSRYDRTVIVRPESDSWILVTQPDHARLSRDLTTTWRRGSTGASRCGR